MKHSETGWNLTETKINLAEGLIVNDLNYPSVGTTIVDLGFSPFQNARREML